MKYINIKSLNQNINEDAHKLVCDAENNYSSQIEQLCRAVNDNKQTHPVLLISGPSGSGKTSTANEISRVLYRDYGCKSSVISLDNYFRSNKSPDMPRDKNGKIDLESPYCTDLPLLQEHLKMLENGDEFMMPVFDFKIQDRSGYVPFQREEGSIAILEGIHALNPLVTGDCGDFALCAYISVRTRLKSDTNRLLHPRMIRLMRRLCRDCLFRGRDIPSVFSFFESVSEGEDKYILPFKHRANFQIDTFMSYEVPVYKNCLQEKLEQVRDSFKDNSYYKNITDFFEFILPLSETNVPETSLIREFIG
ncbi:MAG: uridine kinase [Porcipelethomonas sp.]